MKAKKFNCSEYVWYKDEVVEFIEYLGRGKCRIGFCDDSIPECSEWCEKIVNVRDVKGFTKADYNDLFPVM